MIERNLGHVLRGAGENRVLALCWIPLGQQGYLYKRAGKKRPHVFIFITRLTTLYKKIAEHVNTQKTGFSDYMGHYLSNLSLADWKQFK